MSQSLGQLHVDLTAETGGFVSALSKAAYTAQQTSKEISRSFGELREVAEQTFGAFGDFNPVISKLSFVLETAGRSASSAMKYLSGLGGAIGPLAALGAGAAAGIAALGAVAVGIATEAAESANKLHELSQSTGVSVETLSRFGYAAKQTGVDSEQMTTALERLNKSALAAAIAPAGTANAYTRLGVAVRDANGNIRPTQDLLLDIAHKFATMQDGVAKTALAMQLFGRGGAAIIPFLNEGRNGIQELTDEADRLGVTISGPTAGAAHQFELNLGKIRGAAQGGANSIMSDFLPALTKLSAYFEEGSEKARVWAREIKEGVYTLIPGLALMASLIESLPDPSAKATDPFAGKDIGSWTGQMKPVAIPQPHIATASGRPDVVAELIEKLQAQASAELALAAATEKSASAGVLAKAAAEADIRIAETRTHLLAQEKALRAQLADAKADAAAGTSAESGVEGGATGGTHALRIQAEINGIQKMLAELDKDAPKIKSLYAEIAAGEFGATAAKDLESFIVKTDEETEALQKMAAAYAQGPLAAQQAAEAGKIAPFEKKRADLGEVIGGLKLIGAPAADIEQLQKAYDELGTAIDRAKVSETAFVAAEISEKIGKEKALLASEAEGFRLVAAAALKSAADQRVAAAEAAALKFGAEHPTATGDQLGQVRDTELAKLTQQRNETIAAAAAQFDLNASYSQELEKLQQIKAFLESQGQSTIAIDTKIYETRVSHLLDYQRQVFESDNQQLLGEQKIYEQAIQLTDAWDKAALEVGSLGDKFKAVSNEIQLEGQNLGEHLAENFKTAVDDMSSSLAKFIVTGKGSIRQLFDSLAENALKSTFQYSFSKLFAGITGAAGPGGVGPGGTAGTFPGPLGGVAGALGLKLPGAPGAHAPSSVATMNIAAQVVNLSGSSALGGATSSTGAADGSSASPWYSIFTDSTGNPFGVGNALPITGEASALTSALPFTAGDNQRAFAASGILGLPGLPGAPGTPGANPSLLTSVAGGALGGANGTATAPFYVISAIGALGGFASSSGSSSGPLGSLASVPGQDTYGSAVFGAGAAAPGAAPASGAAGGFIGTILKLFGIGASSSAPGGGLAGAASGVGGGAAGAASSTAAATTMQAAATTMVTAATTMTTAAATMESAAATMSASSSSSGGGGGLFGGLLGGGGDSSGGGGGLFDLFGGGADAGAGAADSIDLSGFADLAAFASGGRVTKGVPYIVGEDRPEVFVPQEHGKIVRSIPDFEGSSAGRAIKAAAQIRGDRAQHFASFDFSNISHRETGGSVTAGVPYLAGEKRPEVFVPDSFSSSSAPRAAGGVHHHYQNTVIQNIQTPDVDSFAKSQDQLHAEAFAAMNRASYRNG